MTRELFEEYDLTVAELNKENQELKKQLEELKFDIVDGKPYIKLDTVITKQQKFINYLEDEIEKATTNPYTKLSEYGMNRIHIYKEILQKYKEIIGVLDDKTN